MSGVAGLVIAIIGIVITVIVVAKVQSGMTVSPKGACSGGPAQGAAGQPLGHGNYRFPCSDGGSTVVHIGG